MIEHRDIYDRQGNPTGLTVEKGAVLDSGQLVLGVHVYIYNASFDFLVQQRSFTKTIRPGAWYVHAGYPMAGETSREGAVREVNEEIGLRLPENDLRFIKRIFWRDMEHMIDVYFARTEYDIHALRLREAEVAGVKSVSPEEMKEIVRDMRDLPHEYRDVVIQEIQKLVAE